MSKYFYVWLRLCGFNVLIGVLEDETFFLFIKNYNCLHCFRRGIALAALGGPIYAIGGLDDNSCFNDVERYDIESDRWSAVAPMNTPRGGVGSVALGVWNKHNSN